MSEKNNIEERKKKYKRGLLLGLIIFITYSILVTSITPKRYDLAIGDIASVDIKATRDTVDELATKEKEKEITEKVTPEKTLNGDIKIKAQENVIKLFDKISNINSTVTEEKDKLSSIKKLDLYNLSDDEYKLLFSLPNEKLSEVNWFIQDTLNLAYEDAIDEDKEENIQRAKNVIDEEIDKKGFERNLEEIIRYICYSEIKPNLLYDKEKTEEKIREALKEAPKQIIKKNQIIVKEGEPITERQIEILKELGLLDTGVGKSNFNIYFVLAIFVALVLGLQYSYIAKERKEIFKDSKMILMISIVSIIALVLARGVSIISPYLIPLACAPIILTVLIDYKVSLVINTLNILLMGVVVDFTPTILILAIVNVIIGSTSLKKIQQRNDVLYATIYMALITAIVTFTTSMLISNNINGILINTGCAVLGAIISGILALGILPFFESSFDVITNIKLLELSNPNHPIMKRLLMEAPGTYHHSMMVANLAEVAAEEVGGNAVVARIGAYYHDIGKIKRPYFFGENQKFKENPHDKITPNLSTLIIISHTKDGVELAREHKIPKVIQDIIEQHHGTTLVKYFYYTLKNSSEKPEEIKEEDFRYPGPTPSSKEAGIIMLADSVEAAVRSISEPTKGKIEEMVNNIIKDKLYSDQLVNCDLTLKDLEVIRKCFLKVLTGIYHQRIEYPTEKKIRNQ